MRTPEEHAEICERVEIDPYSLDGFMVFYRRPVTEEGCKFWNIPF